MRLGCLGSYVSNLLLSKFSLSPCIAENLAVQRVQLISPHIKVALVYGALDPPLNTEPLKVETH